MDGRRLARFDVDLKLEGGVEAENEEFNAESDGLWESRGRF